MTHEDEDHPTANLATSKSSKSVSADNWNKGAVKKSKTAVDVGKPPKPSRPSDVAEKNTVKSELAAGLDGLKPRKKKKRKPKKVLTGEEMLQKALRGLNQTMNDMGDIEYKPPKAAETNPELEAAMKGLKATPNRPLYEGDFEEYEEEDYVPKLPDPMLTDAKKLLRGNANSQHLFSRIEGRKAMVDNKKRDSIATLEDAKVQLKSSKIKLEDRSRSMSVAPERIAPPMPKNLPSPEEMMNLSKEERLAILKAEFAKLQVSDLKYVMGK